MIAVKQAIGMPDTCCAFPADRRAVLLDVGGGAVFGGAAGAGIQSLDACAIHAALSGSGRASRGAGDDAGRVLMWLGLALVVGRVRLAGGCRCRRRA